MSQRGGVKQIGSYQYNERHCLGEGAYGKVFQGQNITSGEIVAIKKMDLALFERDTYLRNQIVSEIEILKKFNHPNIVKFLDLITTARSLYIITEFCKDGDLKELLSKKRLQETEAQGIMLQIINGFKELVKMGVIHRDLKPANILNHEGIVKIADFGFAKYVDNYTSQLLRSCVGSPLYMAPQILQRRTYSTKCDIWSIGVIFYEMVYYDVPWKGRDEQDLLKNILMKPLNFKPGFQVSEFTRGFLTKALMVEEADRISWDQVFQMFETLEKQIVPQSPTLQKLYNDQNISWMNKMTDKMTNEELNKQLQFLNQMRQGLAFSHYANIELSIKIELLKSYCRKDNLVEDCLFYISKLIFCNCNRMLDLINEVCDAGEGLLMKGTKWNILNNVKKELEYYEIFYVQVKDQFQKENDIPEMSDSDRNKMEEIINQKVVFLAAQILDEAKRRSSENVNVECLQLIELLLDAQVASKNISKMNDSDYVQCLMSKSGNDDSRRLSERIQNKMRILQKI